MRGHDDSYRGAFRSVGPTTGALFAYVTFGQVTTVRNLVGLGYLLKPRGLGLLLGIAFFTVPLWDRWLCYDGAQAWPR